eukprot:PhM_4_TR10396/c0_g1_i1/m.87375
MGASIKGVWQSRYDPCSQNILLLLLGFGVLTASFTSCATCSYFSYVASLIALWGFLRHRAKGAAMNGPKSIQITDKDIKAMAGKRVVVTGGNCGIGLETCRALVEHGAHVVMASRSEEKCMQAINDIEQSLLRKARVTTSGTISFIPLDVSSRSSIEAFVAKLRDGFLGHSKKAPLPLDLLVNNAGVMACPWGETPDGFETQFGTNHMGPFLLTHLLIEDLLRGGNCGRVLFVGSQGQFMLAPPKPPSSLVDTYAHVKKHDYDPGTSYGISKLCNSLAAKYFSEKYGKKGLMCVSLHPGVVMTSIMRHVVPSSPANVVENVLFGVVFPMVFKTPIEGVQTTLTCCLAGAAALKNGEYYAECAVSPERHAFVDMKEKWMALGDASEKLWGL